MHDSHCTKHCITNIYTYIGISYTKMAMIIQSLAKSSFTNTCMNFRILLQRCAYAKHFMFTPWFPALEHISKRCIVWSLNLNKIFYIFAIKQFCCLHSHSNYIYWIEIADDYHHLVTFRKISIWYWLKYTEIIIQILC